MNDQKTGDEIVKKYCRATKEELDERNAFLTAYIQKKLQTGQRFFISKDIARETGIDTKRVGRFMHDYPKDKTGFVVEPWGGCRHIVWRITQSPKPDAAEIRCDEKIEV